MKAILTYHSIDDSESCISVSAATFRTHVEWLAHSGVAVVPLTRLHEMPDDVDAIALTFDDGFENFARVAWPLLRDHGLPVTLFVVTDHVGGTNAWSVGRPPAVPHLELLAWPALSRLAAEGLMVGSHTRTHPDLRSVSNERLADEIHGAAQEIVTRTSCQPECFAYPYGGFDARVARAVARVHAHACTTELRAVRSSDDPVELPRLDAFYFRRPGLLESFGSIAFRRYVWLRAGGRRIRQALATVAP